jgi:ribulose-bisphosphate carboxylase large chain
MLAGIMASDRIIARYRIETALPIEQTAEMIAGEQSSGTFLPVPGETEELKARARARVLNITPLESVDAPSLPGGRGVEKSSPARRFQRAEITLSFPLANLGPNLSTLVATVCGNLYELAEHTGCKLIDLELPDAFGERYPGPQFGIEGTRRLTGVKGRPIVGTIIKPSVGLSPRQTADLVRELAEAGIDFVKDDELMADPPHCPLRDRVAAVMQVINEHAERTGKKVMFAFNVTDDLDAMRRHHDTVLAAGGTCIMASIHSVGLPALLELRRHSQLPFMDIAMVGACIAGTRFWAWNIPPGRSSGAWRASIIFMSTDCKTSSGSRTTLWCAASRPV